MAAFRLACLCRTPYAHQVKSGSFLNMSNERPSSLPFLSIAIPTYNRCSAVISRIRTLSPLAGHREIEVLILDNGSEDGTKEKVSKAIQDGLENFRLLTREKNLGFAANFMRAIEASQGEYVMITSDEDDVLLPELSGYIKFLQQRKPSFASPQAIVKNKIYRGRSRESKISAKDFRKSSNYISGIAFHRTTSLPIIEDLKKKIDSNPQVQIYPQVLLTGRLLATHGGYWYPRPMTVQKQVLETSISDAAGRKYYHLASRWDQHKGLLNYFEDALTSASPREKSLIKEMIDSENSAIFGKLRRAMIQEYPDLAKWIPRSSFLGSAIRRAKWLGR